MPFIQDELEGPAEPLCRWVRAQDVLPWHSDCQKHGLHEVALCRAQSAEQYTPPSVLRAAMYMQARRQAAQLGLKDYAAEKRDPAKHAT